MVIGLNAQSIISGWITDKADKKPIDGVVVTLLDAQGEIITYAISKKDGSFSINIKSNEEKLILHARMLGYKDKKREIENRTQRIFIEMSFGEIKMREVVVKSRPMWNREDTLVYSVDAFKSASDKTIGDLLKKLPGVEVCEGGEIKYQGEAINKFYIEGLDLLERQYGIATNNVPMDAVQNVEIIENHQPIQTLKDAVASDKAAVNLRLKKDKLSRPVGNVVLGTGYSNEMLWLAEVFAMSAERKQQSIVMYKTNNTSKDIGAEITSQSLSRVDFQDVSSFSQKKLLNALSISYPPLEKKRYLFNKSHVVSANNLWKTGETSQLRINIQYLNDALKENSSRKSEYLLPDGVLKINEINSLSLRTNMVDAAITYIDNSPHHYLNNVSSWNGSWSKSLSSIAVNNMGVRQNFDLPACLIKNNLQYVKKWGNRIWNFTSFVVYSYQPQHLSVLVDTISKEQSQYVKLSEFYTRNSTYYSLEWNNSNFILIKGGIETFFDRFKSQMFHPVFTDSVRSDVSSNYVVLEFIPSYMYRKDRLTLNADISLQKHFFRTNGLILYNHKKDIPNFFFLNPSLRLNYRLSPMLIVKAGYNYSQAVGDILDFTDVYFMSAYRNFSKKTAILPHNKRQSFNAGFQYRNPLINLFLNSSIVYSSFVRNVIVTQHFIGNESVVGNKKMETQSNSLIWTGYIGKYFSELRTNISLSTSYNSIYGERYQQNVLFPFHTSGWIFMPNFTTKISDAGSITYQVIGSNRITEIKGQNQLFRTSIWQVMQQLSAFYLIGKKWEINGKIEHSFNEIGDRNSVKIFFADLGVTYRLPIVEFNFSATNLFNEHKYYYLIYNGLDKYDYSYNLQPRMFILSVKYKF